MLRRCVRGRAFPVPAGVRRNYPNRATPQPPVNNMTNSDWIELFQLIPPEQHNTLLLVTESGVNLGIEMIFRTEPAYMVFRGRVCGNTDEGRVFFLPYTHIDYVNINRIVMEQEIRDLYSKYDTPQSGEAAEAAVAEGKAGEEA